MKKTGGRKSRDTLPLSGLVEEELAGCMEKGLCLKTGQENVKPVCGSIV